MSAGQLVYVAANLSGNGVYFIPASGTEWYLLAVSQESTDSSGKYAQTFFNDISGGFSSVLVQSNSTGFQITFAGKQYFDDNIKLGFVDGDTSNHTTFYCTLIQVL